MKTALCQINPKVGAIDANLAKIVSFADKAASQSTKLAVMPELAICAYPPEDLLHRDGFVRRCEQAVEDLANKIDPELYLVLGSPMARDNKIYNCAFILHQGGIKHIYKKQILPNYSVFDEKRYFTPGNESLVLEIENTKIGITICEDLWDEKPARLCKEQGADLIVNINASPYHIDKATMREKEIKKRCLETGLDIIYVNQVGAQDELIFDGASFIMNSKGKVIKQLPAFSENLQTIQTNSIENQAELIRDKDKLQSIYNALMLGIKDYVEKNNFNGVLLGLSGGIDSALTLALATVALGRDQVEAVLMPSRFTAQMSIDDSIEMADGLKVKYQTISIEPIFNSFLDTLKPILNQNKFTVTEENIQARIRGIILMALSNQTGKMLLTTGNKSEMAVGYATLYGDMAGGFAPLKDVSKTLVYELAKWINRKNMIIPDRIISRPPTAELAEDQRDTDSLPPYDILDPILERYVERYECVSEIVAAGFDAKIVKKITHMVDRNEYKRRQSPPGIRITRRAYGKDRRYPITNGFISN